MTALLDEYDWVDFVNLNIDDCWNVMYIHAVDTLCPVKTFKFSKKNKPTWLTNDLIFLMKERD